MASLTDMPTFRFLPMTRELPSAHADPAKKTSIKMIANNLDNFTGFSFNKWFNREEMRSISYQNEYFIMNTT
jgi:hypothetical protein